MLMELVAVFLFVSVIITVATDDSAPWKGVLAPVAIGGFIFAAAVTIGPSSGGSFNPARSIDPAIWAGEFGQSLDLHRRPAHRRRARRRAVDRPPGRRGTRAKTGGRAELTAARAD